MPSDLEKLNAVRSQSYSEQAKAYMNAYWDKEFCGNDNDCEWLYSCATSLGKLDKKHGDKGCKIDQLTGHRFLEKNADSLTWTKLREDLEAMDFGFKKKNSTITLIDFLIHQKAKDWKAFVNRPQGSMSIEEKKLLDEAVEQLDEVRKSLNEIKQQEAAKKKKMDSLRKKSTDESIGVVKRGIAVQELKKLEGEDPLPLRQAKITLQAAFRRCNKTVKKLKSSMGGGLGGGTLWWMERELQEAMKYLPSKSKKLKKMKAKQKKIQKTANSSVSTTQLDVGVKVKALSGSRLGYSGEIIGKKGEKWEIQWEEKEDDDFNGPNPGTYRGKNLMKI